ncbi:MAG: DUF4363 family protein [Oscillospiraceae bacterium]|nr:DUF4363 family protein [Oscillospiraceae bacterium]
MKRETGAAALLILLLAVSLWNIRRVDQTVDEIEEHLKYSEKAALGGDSAFAEAELEAALRLWRAADNYTHVFIRHPEIDTANDAFYTLMQLLRAGEGRSLTAAYDQLRYHLEGIASMEHIRVGSVF